MEKTLTLGELYSLADELGGSGENATVPYKGLLNHKINMSTRVKISQLLKVALEAKKDVDRERNIKVKEYGTEDPQNPGKYLIATVTTEKDENGKEVQVFNPEFEKFAKEFNELAEVTRTFTINFTLEDISTIETEEHYPVLMKLFV